MAGIIDPGVRDATGGNARSPSLRELLGMRQAARKSAADSSAYLLGTAGARIAARNRVAQSEARLMKAAEALQDSSPSAARVTTTTREQIGTERVVSTRTITSEVEVVTPATAAAQLSIAFQSADQTVARQGGRLEFRVGASTYVRIDLGTGGASLAGIAQLLNADSQNTGLIEARVVSSEDGFRLEVTTTATGQSARLRIRRDNFTAPVAGTPTDPPLFGTYTLIDPSLAREWGTNESSELITTSEEVTTVREVPIYRQRRTTSLVDDASYEVLAREFVDAFNALRSEVASQLEPPGPGRAPRLLAEDVHVNGLSASFSALRNGFGDLRTEAGLGFEAFGITLDPNGDLQLDHAAFQAALADEGDAIGELWRATQKGLAPDRKSPPRPESPSHPLSGFATSTGLTRDADAGSQGRLLLLGALFGVGSSARSSDPRS